MTVFHFETISPDAALAIQPTDFLFFSGGPARLASVNFSPVGQAPETIAVTLGGHTVTFGAALATLSINRDVVFEDRSELVVGTPGDDNLLFSGPDSAMFGDAGNDFLAAASGDNVLQGNQGNDTLDAGLGSDTFFGGQGDDFIFTDDRDFLGDLPGNNFAQGNLGNDTIFGGDGSDILLGGKGNDRIEGGGGVDILDGNLGDDLVVSDGAPGAQLFGEDGADTLVAESRGQILSGGAGADLFSFSVSSPDGISGSMGTILDWSSEDRLSAPGFQNPNAYAETTANDFVGALAAANALIRSDDTVIAVQVGADVMVFFQLQGSSDADLAITLAGRSLADISAQNIVG